ncbi:MAG: flavodoxin-dependent (E)-4-hydroxy-3-methylbut-2-enyl-diphosphate synthase [Clostridia bacterium]|nr:flavodoxin-dependent (E)-4-hydroxy-3-methylbut-2-enyl-diphosphate synthase [Clostridia bacterium]
MTRQVIVGGTPIGGGARVTIQSMTNTDTRDVDATVAQIRALEDAGCDIVRVSVYDSECVEAIGGIVKRIRIPLVADVHFDYRLAVGAIERGANKVRINPGNIGSDENVRLLSEVAKRHSVPIRIGVNGGSLERELLQKHGKATAEAMVESSMRHIALLERHDFRDIVVSMKSSSVRTTVEAYRLLRTKCDYPFHIGVTEAGFGEDALVKGAIGIGALLLDSIGDTVRVSMTGDPVREVLAAQSILAAVGVKRAGVEVISCPTCGRTAGDVEGLAQVIAHELRRCAKPLKVAVMGCVVNGPGEAREADVGIAFAPGGAVVFAGGEKCFSGGKDEAVAVLVETAKAMAAGRSDNASAGVGEEP